MLTNLLAKYRPQSGGFDEMLDEAKLPRPHWRTILDSLADETPENITRRLDMVQRHVRENGVTYNVYTDAKGMQRPWNLNFLPFILPEHEWAEIEAGVIQRATLLNQILVDVYGDQTIIKEGLVPPTLIHGHGGFLRPCHGIRHLDNIALHFYAIDLARAPSGRWWVVADRTQAPSGAGYALENRSAMARTFPDLLRDLKVRHLTDFFTEMLKALTHWGKQCAAQSGMPLRANEPPLIVLLTPGPFNETYFEHAYLARHLGVPLVEGSDLTVRNGMVWLKSLAGLQRVHVIMRRVDDDFCDPLELKADSTLGIAGLTLAARLGNVLITNSLGSSLLESGALLGFLPKLCERLLGQTLTMPSVATWWCGEPAALNTVIEKIDQLVIKPSFPQLRLAPVFGQDLNAQERERLIKAIRNNPQNYVAQEMVKLSQAPVWQPGSLGGLSSCSIGLRVYACATPNGYIVMPGGLTRAATGTDTRIITMQRGGGSKDTWVQASNHSDIPGSRLTRTITSDELVRDDTHLSSRMAENLFWFGRHADRCDNTTRLLRVALNYRSNNTPAERGSEWPAIKSICTWYELIAKPETPEPASQMQSQTQQQISGVAKSEAQLDAQIEATLLSAVVKPDVPGLAQQLQQLHSAANHLSERFSIDNWRVLNQMVSTSDETGLPLSQSDAMLLLDDVTAALMTLTGFTLDGMTRDLGWNFLSLGRRLERLQFQSIALQRALRMDPGGDLNWLLELSDSIVTYRARYRSKPEWLPVLDLLLLDESNPRSILFQIDGIGKSLKKIARTYGPCGEDKLLQSREALLKLNVDTGLYCGNEQLIAMLSQIWSASATISEQISLQFFSYTGQHLHRKQA
ncbi:putative circularly permuted ATP-grasp superfamily protein/putative alpha-E superfamily protein [Oxalobacteraceae bacterium GrIS 1.18]